MDRNFRLFGKISVLDLLIIGALVAFVLLARMFALPAVAAGPADGADASRLHFTVELDKQETGYEQNIAVGDAVYDNLKGSYLGDVVAVEAAPFLGEADDFESGIRKREPVDGLVSVLVTVECASEQTANATLVGDYEVAVGKEMFLRGPGFASAGYCVEMDFEGGAS